MKLNYTNYIFYPSTFLLSNQTQWGKNKHFFIISPFSILSFSTPPTKLTLNIWIYTSNNSKFYKHPTPHTKHEDVFTKRKLKTSKKLFGPMAPTNPLVRIVVVHYITLTKPSKLSNVDVSELVAPAGNQVHQSFILTSFQFHKLRRQSQNQVSW